MLRPLNHSTGPEWKAKDEMQGIQGNETRNVRFATFSHEMSDGGTDSIGYPSRYGDNGLVCLRRHPLTSIVSSPLSGLLMRDDSLINCLALWDDQTPQASTQFLVCRIQWSRPIIDHYAREPAV